MFGKVFAQIYEGTLTSRRPWEALVTFQQMTVLANRHGEVDMTADAISRRTTIPLDIIEKGLRALLEPAPESRSKAKEGRRIVPLDPERNWGWRLVNYDHYRKIRCEDERREYMRNLMAEKRSRQKGAKATSVSSTLAPVSDVSPCSMQDAVCNKNKPLFKTGVLNDSPLEASEKPSPKITDSKQSAPAGFDAFWKLYPKKQAKKDAIKAWRKLQGVDLEVILTAVRAASLTEAWRKEGGRFVPLAATWLKGRRWEDELAPAPLTANVPKLHTVATMRPARRAM